MKRIEALTRTDNVAQGLQAHLADPLWMLGRQWQVGELSAEDAASPVYCTATVQHCHVSRLHGADSAAVNLGSAPLESAVEREPVAFGTANVRLLAGQVLNPGERDAALRRAALAGRWLLRAVQEAVGPSVPASEAEAWLRALRKLAAFTVVSEDPGTRLLLRGSIDGQRAYDLLGAVASGEALVPALGLGPAALAGAKNVYAAVKRWRASVEASFLAPGVQTWDREDAAHRFSIETVPGGPQLTARDYRGGRLDWFSMDVATPAKAELRDALQVESGALPRAVRYAGMPASRFWEFEDTRVSFGGWKGRGNETVRWLLAEFAVVYGDDWFTLPVELPYGSLCRVTRLTVHDCFGGREDVPSTAAGDGDSRAWRFFALEGDATPAGTQSPWLWMAPVLPDRQEGEPVEELLVLRDETSNVAWGVELRVEGANGRAQKRAGRAEPPDTGEPGTWTYHVAPQVPPGWTPLMLEEGKDDAGKPQRFLRRGRLPGWTANDLPRGRLLDATAPLRMTEAGVPRGGLVITRAPQRTRSADGRVWTWTGREVRPGAGPAESSLAFDRLERR
jgi:hypothetical protein